MRALRKSDLKFQMREQAKQKVRPSTANLGSDRKYHQDVETGRQQLMRAASEGGDPQAKRIKGELTYLLNNYLPTYDTRIEQLIDAWRRSGDPTYDPGVRTKLTQARRDHMGKSNAI